VNGQHLKAFVWLRWKLRLNQLRKGGTFSRVLLAVVSVLVALAAVGLFLGGFFAGLYGLPKVPAGVPLLIWDGLAAAFLFWWLIGLLTELQRSDPLTLDKFLHLPVSPTGVFFVNYVSSLFNVTLVLFTAGVVGLLLGQTLAVGPVMLLGVLPFAAFIFAVTAATYQLQGWLAVLMSNPRRRRTIVMLLTFGVILVSQVPNLFNLARLGRTKPPKVEKIELPPPVQATPASAPAPPPAVQKIQDKLERDRKEMEELNETAWWMNAALPPGWFPLGVSSLASGNVLPALLGTLGLGAIGGYCFRRAYRTTVRYSTGQIGGSEATGGAKKPDTPVVGGKPPLVERSLPGVSEHASAVAMGSLRGLLRAPEAKMLFLAPVVILVVFGGVLFSLPFNIPLTLRPTVAVGVAAFMLFTGIQVAGNLFGYDRAGFRAFVLSPVPRSDVLFGKNLALAPLLLGMGLVAALLIGCVFPMRWHHYPTVLVMVTTLYLAYCLLTNTLSIYAPIPIAAGAMNPKTVKLTPLLWQLGFMLVFPQVTGLVLAPLGVEALLDEFAGLGGWPIALVLSVGLLGLTWLLYRSALTAQGNWLAKKEKDILQVVVSQVE
jgi:hypothetical protein